jgi:hypothetical protein
MITAPLTTSTLVPYHTYVLSATNTKLSLNSYFKALGPSLSCLKSEFQAI